MMHKALAKNSIAIILIAILAMIVAGCASSKCGQVNLYKTDYKISNLTKLDIKKFKESLLESASKENIVNEHKYTKRNIFSADIINWTRYSRNDARGMIEIEIIECNDSSAAAMKLYEKKAIIETYYKQHDIECESVAGRDYCMSQIIANKSDPVPLGLLCTETGAYESQAMIRQENEIIVIHERMTSKRGTKIKKILDQYGL